MNIEYKIDFHSYWQCGSGLSKGADVDLLVIKTKEKLPYVPGRTIKGLVKDALLDVFHFGNKDNYIKDIDPLLGGCFFSNAILDKKESDSIKNNGLEEYLYKSIAMTKIDISGIAEGQTLRKIQVTVPCSLYGTIENVPQEIAGDIFSALKYIKQLGTGRNRGFGRCTITIIS